MENLKAERKKREKVPEKTGKTRFCAVGCIAGSVLLYLILTLTAKPEGPVSPDGTIRRDTYGGEEKEYKVYVEGLKEQEVPVTVAVGARIYTDKEADAAFTQIMDGMEERIRGANPSLSEVREDLTLPVWLEDYGVRLRWYSSDPEVLDSFGKISPDVQYDYNSEGKTVYLGVQITDGTHKQEYEIPVQVLPPVEDERLALEAGLEREIRQREERQRTENVLSLPTEYEGKTLHYRTDDDSGYEVLLVLGILLAVLCPAKARADVQKREKERARELLLDYAELVSKLMVFIGAGMTARGAWERVVRDYEAALAAGRQKRRAAYEEMSLTYYQLKSGMPEGDAYREFGSRCRQQPYLKLSSLLEQNRKAGTKNLRAILQTEMTDAFEQRKNLARRLGEEAGTKLLLPLFLMLGIVMVMIMVPAMMSMG